MLTGSCHCGRVTWTFDGEPDSATACNCTPCRRYGAMWIYDYEGERVALSGPTTGYRRVDEPEPVLENLFCPVCGNIAAWCGLKAGEDGRRRMAVNVRLAEPETVAWIPIRHFDGLDTWEDLPADGRCVRDLWF